MIEERRILLEFRHAYNKCLSCLKDAENDLKKYGFEQRIDEIILIFSSLNNISVNQARDVLCVNSETEVKDGI